MRVVHRQGIWVAIATIDEREAVKQAGFTWHPGHFQDEGGCRFGPGQCYGCRVGLKKGWWTRRPETAARLAAYADPDAKAALSEHQHAVKMSWATDADIEIPVPDYLDYLPYQRAGIAYMHGREGTLLGDDPGLGKTIQVLGLINLVKSIQQVLVVCPATLRSNWRREAERWLVHDERVWKIYVVDEDAPIPYWANFVIVHYNRVALGYKPCKGPCHGKRREPLACPQCKGTGDGPKPPLVCSGCSGKKFVFCPECRGKGKFAALNLRVIESLMERSWDLLAVDEAHWLKNLKAARSRAVLGDPYKKKSGLTHRAQRKVFMTGTPIPNRPIEIWPIVSTLAPKEFGALRPFAIRYCKGHEEYVAKGKKVFRLDGASNLEELQEKLRSTCMIRRLKKDVLKDLPPKRRQIIPLTPTDEAKKLIAQEQEEWDKKFGADAEMVQAALDIAEQEGNKEAYESAAERLQYIQKIAFVEMARIRRQIALVKLPSIIEHLQGMFEQNIDKIICFAHHKEIIQQLITQFGSAAVSIYGETKNEDRQKAVDAFQNDPKIKLFVGGIMAAGVGLTLTAASNVVFAEEDWVPGNISQAEDRAHRIGQKNSVLIQHLVLDGSLDARMIQLVVEKQEIADRALDRGTNVTIKNVVSKPREPMPPVELWKKVALKEAMIALAERRDISVEGGHGFSQFDAPIGQSLATARRPYSDEQAHLALKLATKYRRQLSLSNERLAKQLEIYEVEPPKKQRRGQKTITPTA